MAIEIAEQLGAEIINADSRQVYRGMDIGTAKPSADELRRVPHHLIDLRSPDRPLDAAQFAAVARTAITEIAGRRRPVLVVGGSGLYLRAIREGIFVAPPASPEIRARLADVAAEHGTDYLFARLARIDPEAAGRIKPNDLRRITRALEIHEQTGIRISEHQRRHQFADRPFESLTVGLTLPREELYRCIDRRFEAMIAEGLVGEVRSLLAAGYELPLSTIGYREIAAFVRDEASLAEAIARAKCASRRLAKRQLTWFRADPEILWLDGRRDAEKALKLFQQFFSGEIARLPAASSHVHLADATARCRRSGLR
jgi:tRNA dimethylallyltransferase